MHQTSIPESAARAPSPYRETADVLTAAANRVAESPWLKLHDDRLQAFDLAAIHRATPYAWRDCLPEYAWPPTTYDDAGLALRPAIIEYALNAAMQGGMWGVEHDRIVQWEHDGSGSAAVQWVINFIRDRYRLPDTSGAAVRTSEDLARSVQLATRTLPYATHRAAIYLELNTPAASMLLHQMFLGALSHPTVWTWRTVRTLQQAFPHSFGGDPYAKKALLFLLYLQGWLHAVGVTVATDLIIPCDYEMPRICQHLGFVTLTDAARDRLRTPALLGERDELTMDLRASAAVCAHTLATRAGVEDFMVDAAMFGSVRAETSFKTNGPPLIRVATMWF